jgi:mannose-6-phosphate isomerase
MGTLYPLRFQPVFKRYLWGGRRLGAVLSKPIGPGDDYAESWEVADHGHGQSIVANGPLAGTTLRELVQQCGDELLGPSAERHGGRSLQQTPQPRFPLIFKYLDCNQNLSVQVHPDDAAASRLSPPDMGKTEAWLILHALPGSRIYAGLNSSFDRQALEREVRSGRTEHCISSFEALAGQCVFIPAGTLHALGAGLLVAEIQQSSDTTYRLYDWGRVGPNGQPRQLHIDEALSAIDYSARRVLPQTPQPTDRLHVQRLVACDKFNFDRWELTQAHPLGGDNRFHILSVLEGKVMLESWPEQIESRGGSEARASDDASSLSLTRGQTVLLPACLPAVSLTPKPRAVLVDVHVP